MYFDDYYSLKNNDKNYPARNTIIIPDTPTKNNELLHVPTLKNVSLKNWIFLTYGNLYIYIYM